MDFSKFGEVEEVALTRLMQVGAANLHRSWLNIPHVTQFDQEIAELDLRVAAFAQANQASQEEMRRLLDSDQLREATLIARRMGGQDR